MFSLLGKLWVPVYEDPPVKDDPIKDDPPVKDDPKKTNFSQEEVNTILAKDRRKHQVDLQTAVDELEAIKTKADLSKQERTDLDGRIEELQNQLLTKEELADKEKVKISRKHADTVKALEADVVEWKARFTTSTIDRAITDAASAHKAFANEQIVALLKPNTQLTEELDKEGGKTGNLVPRVQFQDTDKDGKPVTLDLAVGEAVKRMTEIDKYLNLFQGDGTGGLGASTKPGTKPEDMSTLAKDPAKYRAARKAGKLTFD